MLQKNILQKENKLKNNQSQQIQNIQKDQYCQINILAEKLHPHYKKFNVANRLLFNGHSHQAWPDVAFETFSEYEKLVCQKADHKWDKAFEQLQTLRQFLRQYYDDPTGQYCRGCNTHTLLTGWLSSLDLKNRPKIITTKGQFLSMYRQLQIFSKQNIAQVTFVPVEPLQTLPNRLIAQIDERTSAVMCSRVFFQTSRVLKNIRQIAQACRAKGAYYLIDDYHGTNVRSLSFKKEQLQDIFLVTGGYKYLQWGQGNCFLRYPANYNRYPTTSGWMSSFGDLQRPRVQGVINFDEGPLRFSSGTFDPFSIFRASKVAKFFKQMGLTSLVLQNQYKLQNRYFRQQFKKLEISPQKIKLRDDINDDNFGGFVALLCPKAKEVSHLLQEKQIFHDFRQKIIRLGLAPYITTGHIDRLLQKLKQSIEETFN